MSLSQMDDFTYKHSSQVTPLYTSFTTAQVKSNFDSRGVELRTFINNLITTLNSLDGAGNIGSTPIASGSGSTVHDQLVWLLGQIAAASSGTIVDGSIGEVKLAPDLLNKINNALSNEGLLSLLETIDKSSLVNALNEILNDLITHEDDTTKHITAEERTAWNAKQTAIGYTPLNKAGDTATGVMVAQNNTSYSTKQVRNITLSTSAPSGGANGDIWFVYTV